MLESGARACAGKPVDEHCTSLQAISIQEPTSTVFMTSVTTHGNTREKDRGEEAEGAGAHASRPLLGAAEVALDIDANAVLFNLIQISSASLATSLLDVGRPFLGYLS